MTSPPASAASPSQSFPREERLARRRDFVAVYEEGTKLFGSYYVLFVRPNGLPGPRLGITATRKFGKAHDRNKAKRRVREIYRQERDAAGLSGKPLDLVVNVKSSAGSAEFKALRQDLVRLMTKAARVTGLAR